MGKMYKAWLLSLSLFLFYVIVFSILFTPFKKIKRKEDREREKKNLYPFPELINNARIYRQHRTFLSFSSPPASPTHSALHPPAPSYFPPQPPLPSPLPSSPSSSLSPNAPASLTSPPTSAYFSISRSNPAAILIQHRIFPRFTFLLPLDTSHAASCVHSCLKAEKVSNHANRIMQAPTVRE